MLGEIAKAHQIARCHQCGKVCFLGGLENQYSHICPRCDAHISFREEASLQTTWALLITAIILFFPANLLPMMSVHSFGKGKPDTIISGVINLMHHEMYPIALIVFVASILVPLFKVIGLSILCLAVHLNWKINHLQATLMFRFIRFIGRWSMLDLFVIAILSTLVNLGFVASIHAGPASTAFGALVVVTMFAAHTFDQRLIWDLLEQ